MTSGDRIALRELLEKGSDATFLRDLDAVRAALALPWSTGPVEGQISRLKTLKRAMCGRASLELLRQRVLQPAE